MTADKRTRRYQVVGVYLLLCGWAMLLFAGAATVLRGHPVIGTQMVVAGSMGVAYAILRAGGMRW